MLVFSNMQLIQGVSLAVFFSSALAVPATLTPRAAALSDLNGKFVAKGKKFWVGSVSTSSPLSTDSTRRGLALTQTLWASHVGSRVCGSSLR